MFKYNALKAGSACLSSSFLHAEASFFSKSNIWECSPVKQKARLISSKQMLSRDCVIFSAHLRYRRTSCEFEGSFKITL